MGPSEAELAVFFDGLSDDELARRASGGRLTQEAQALAQAELRRRDLTAPAPLSGTGPDADERAGAQSPITGGPSHVLLGRYLDTVAAYTLRARLEAEGIPVLLNGVNHHQVLGIISPVLGGTGVEVPRQHAERALAIKQAFEAGELSLPENFGAELRDEPPAEGMLATDRKRLRELAVACAVIMYGGYMVLIVVLNILRAWEGDPGFDPLDYWPAFLPVLYLAAALMLAWRSKWSLLLFATHLLASLAIYFTYWNDAASLGHVFVQAAGTGVILYYGLYLLGQGRLQ